LWFSKKALPYYKTTNPRFEKAMVVDSMTSRKRNKNNQTPGMQMAGVL
jgi:hypothetical protein